MTLNLIETLITLIYSANHTNNLKIHFQNYDNRNFPTSIVSKTISLKKATCFGKSKFTVVAWIRGFLMHSRNCYSPHLTGSYKTQI